VGGGIVGWTMRVGADDLERFSTPFFTELERTLALVM
jgi:hypothetical protein